MNPLYELRLGPWVITDTIVTSLAITLGLLVILAVASRGLQIEGLSWWQTVLEMFTSTIETTVAEVLEEDPAPYVPLIGSLMLFIGIANLLSIVPVVRSPTADLAVPVALALVVFLAVPYFGIRRHGLMGYLRTYVRPHPLLLPLNLVGEFSRTIALAIRLFGNMMSAQLVGAILLLIAAVLVPVPLMMLGILTALVQAYIFGVLAIVYIAAAVRVDRGSATAGGTES